MVSLGMGTTVLSSAMSPAMSQYPPCDRADRYQSENSCSSADTGAPKPNRALAGSRSPASRPVRPPHSLRLGGRGGLRKFAPGFRRRLLRIAARILPHGAHLHHGRIPVGQGHARIDRLARGLRPVEGVPSNSSGTAWSDRATYLGAAAVSPSDFATLSHDSPASSRLTASAAARRQVRAALLLPGGDDFGAHGLERLLLRQFVIGGAQHDAAALLDLDDRAQAPVEHILAESRLQHRRRIAGLPRRPFG